MDQEPGGGGGPLRPRQCRFAAWAQSCQIFRLFLSQRSSFFCEISKIVNVGSIVQNTALGPHQMCLEEPRHSHLSVAQARRPLEDTLAGAAARPPATSFTRPPWPDFPRLGTSVQQEVTAFPHPAGSAPTAHCIAFLTSGLQHGPH